MLEIIAYCFGGLTVIVFVAFVIAMTCMQEEQFAKLNKEIEELRKKNKS